MNTVIKLVIITAITLQGSLTYAQRDAMLEKVQARKVAFITDALDLSVKEAQVFWPVYNEHQAQMKALREQYPSPRLDDLDNVSDEEASKVVEDFLKRQQEEKEAVAAHIKEISKVLPPQKVAKLITLESAFKRKLLQAMQNRKGRQGKASKRFKE